jgi:hypothetical protein
MGDGLPDPTLESTRRSSRLSQEEQDLVRPLVQSRRSSRQYVCISPPPTDSFSLTRSYPPRTEALPAFTDPWRPRSSFSSKRLPAAPEICSPQGQAQAGPSASSMPTLPAYGESRAIDPSPSTVSEDTVMRLPLTLFPLWRSNSDRDCEATSQAARDQDMGQVRGCHCNAGCVRKGQMHAVVLTMQHVTFVGLFCLWVGVAFGGIDQDSTFWH